MSTEPTGPNPGTRRVLARRAFLLAVPVATALVVAGHPPDPAVATDLGARTGRYVAIHVGLLFMLPLLGITLWLLLDGITGAAATVARLAIPVTLVFYAAFDALVGIGAGVLSREAVGTAGAERVGAEALAARWMEIPMPLPLVSTIAVLSFSVAFLAAAVAHHRAGSSWLAVGGLAMAGPLFAFGHPLVLGLVGMGALLVAVAALELPAWRRRAGDVEEPRRPSAEVRTSPRAAGRPH